MLLEAIKGPITYRWPQGEILLLPGKPVHLPDDRARRLLEKALGKVRVVEPDPVAVGAMIEWDSPLFGLLRGEVLVVAEKAVTVWHPLAERPATIPLAWCRPVNEEGT